VKNIAMWDGQAWFPLGAGASDRVNTLAELPSGELVAGGHGLVYGTTGSAYLARYTFTNTPWVALHPAPFTTTPGATVTLSATPATGYDNLTFQWQRETFPGSGQWANLTDGPGGASPNGGTVMNSSGTIDGGQETLLSISNLALSDAGDYRCVVSNPCGQDESNPAQLTITNPCPPDLTTTAIPGSAGYGLPNGTLNNDDFFYFLAAFAAGNAAVADLTTSAVPGPGYGVPNGVINNDDFFYYLILYAQGC
jgi:hypothetical protein